MLTFTQFKHQLQSLNVKNDSEKIKNLFNENEHVYFFPNINRHFDDWGVSQIAAQHAIKKTSEYWLKFIEKNDFYQKNCSSYVTCQILNGFIENPYKLESQEFKLISKAFYKNHFTNYYKEKKFIEMCRLNFKELLPFSSKRESIDIFLKIDYANKHNQSFDLLAENEKNQKFEDFLNQKHLDWNKKNHLLFFVFVNNMIATEYNRFFLEDKLLKYKKNNYDDWIKAGFSQEYIETNIVQALNIAETSVKMNKKIKKFDLKNVNLQLIPANMNKTLSELLLRDGKFMTCKNLDKDYKVNHLDCFLNINNKYMTKNDNKEMFKKFKNLDFNQIDYEFIKQSLFTQKKLCLYLDDEELTFDFHQKNNLFHLFFQKNKTILDKVILENHQKSKLFLRNTLEDFMRNVFDKNKFITFLKELKHYIYQLDYQGEFNEVFKNILIEKSENIQKNYYFLNFENFKIFIDEMSEFLVKKMPLEIISFANQKMDEIICEISKKTSQTVYLEDKKEIKILMENIEIIKKLQLDLENQNNHVKLKKI